MTRTAHGLAGLAALLLAAPAPAASERLYTAPDASCPGGIRGRVARPDAPLEQVLAVPSDAPERVYAGRVDGADRRGFLFEGLPMRKYDLVLIYENRFFEGLDLHRGADTLTDADRAAIEAAVRESEPFFTRKTVHRLEGETGRGGEARCICTYLRDKGSSEGLFTKREDHRRTFKLVMLRQVGPGWQIVRARDLYPVYVPPPRGRPAHAYAEVLHGIRVTDYVKDLGEIQL
ncbi:MAG: hypothetical protein JW951_04945 [Lentisphaerae bacterium]|nr:hypothetical protein [Lentisphaerota bacterium]